MKNNIALVDGQNLYQGIKGDGWNLDTKKFRQHLKDKYGVRKAYYYFGVRDPHLKNLYSSLRKSDFILKFKEHHKTAKSQKKGNVDTLIVFEVISPPVWYCYHIPSEGVSQALTLFAPPSSFLSS